jgi:hypothetical protein
MPVALGNTTISKVYLGSTEVTKAYLGSGLVYETAPAYDPDALAYITAVETADGEPLETLVKGAINDFVVGLKADGLWASMGAMVLLSGARTLSGALVPVVGPAATSHNFIEPDYNRKTGLKGIGSTKYLDSNNSNYSDPATNAHISVWDSDKSTTYGYKLSTAGERNAIANGDWNCRVRSNWANGISGTRTSSFIGASRSSSAGITARRNSNNIFYNLV